MSASSDAVTAVVPTHDRAHVLPMAVQAILGQRGVDVRVVVVDEASTDGTGAWLAELATRDARVTTVRHDVARGLPAARNAGLQRVETPWVAFCDDDDVWAPDKLALQVAAAGASGACWALCGAALVDGDMRVIGHQRAPDGQQVAAALRRGNPVPGGGSGVLARTEVVRRVGAFDETLRSCEDWDLWLRLSALGAPAVVDRPLVAYRQWAGSMTTNVATMRVTHADVRRRVGDGGRPSAEFDRFLARQLLRSGATTAAASAFATLAWEHRSPVDLARAVLAVAAPSRLDSCGRARAAASVPEPWRRELDAWLPAARVVGSRR